MKKEKNKRVYENGEIRVFWQADKCQHAAHCVHGNPKVFDPERKPWIILNDEKGTDIARIIDRCPSGALSYELKNN